VSPEDALQKSKSVIGRMTREQVAGQ